MNLSEFIQKLKSRYIWANIAAMVILVIVLVVAAAIGLAVYTHHGESIPVPEIRHKSLVEARHMIEEAGLLIEVTDTGYVKELPADCVLEQNPVSGTRVKGGHVIRIVVNASSTPSLALPDIVDNCSLREAMAKLKAMGFKLGMPQYVEGEKDWVYGVTVDGRKMSTGDRILIDKTVIIQVGNGYTGDDDQEQYVDFNLDDADGFDEAGEIDDFEEVL